MALGTLPVARPLENSEITPAGVIRPMRPEVRPSVNHTLPSGPAVIPWDSPPVSPSAYSVTVPAGVVRARREPQVSVGARGDPFGLAVGAGGELGDLAGGTDPPDRPG